MIYSYAKHTQFYDFLHLFVVKRELEAEAAALAEKEKAAAAEACISQIC